MTASPATAGAPVPRHLAVIMDGNGRWAQRRRRPRAIGHRAGARAVNRVIDFCLERGIGALTLFAFSSENWGRPEEEVGALMKLFLNALDREVEELHRRQVRVRFACPRCRAVTAARRADTISMRWPARSAPTRASSISPIPTIPPAPGSTMPHWRPF